MTREEIEKKLAELKQQREQLNIEAVAKLNFLDGKIQLLEEMLNPPAEPSKDNQ